MSVRLDNLSGEEAAEYVISAAQRGKGGRLVNPNVDVMRQVAMDRSLRPLLLDADLVLPDGMPLLWAARFTGEPTKRTNTCVRGRLTLSVPKRPKTSRCFSVGRLARHRGTDGKGAHGALPGSFRQLSVPSIWLRRRPTRDVQHLRSVGTIQARGSFLCLRFP